MSADVLELSRPLTADEQADVVAARAEVKRIAAQVSSEFVGWAAAAGLTRADLIAIGEAALVRVRLEFDETRGTAFRVFARKGVRWAMLDALRNGSLHQRALWRGAERAAEGLEEDGEPGDASAWLDQALHCAEMIAAGMMMGLSPADPESALMSKELRGELHAAVEEEGEAVRELMVRHHSRGEPLEEVGRSLGMSRTTVKRKHRVALARIAARMGKKR